MRLEESSRKIFDLAEEAAIAERDYRKALAREIIMLREQGMPVGMITDVSRGNLSDLRFKRDLAAERYKAGRDAIKAIQSQLSALQSILRTQEEI